MSYPPQDPHGSQSGQYGSQSGQYGSQSGPYGSGSYPSGQYPPPNASDDFWRHVAGNQPPPPPKKSRTGLIITLVSVGAVVLLAAVVTVVLVLVNSADRRIEAGDCMSLASERGGRMTPADCGSEESDYQVVDVRQGQNPDACQDNYNNVTEGSTYCIVLDVKVGDCLTSYQESDEILPLKIDCGRAEDQVTRVADSEDPETACQEEEGYYVFDNRTVCFGDVQGT
ncbi:LppU/SCO3897 family protein [Saccharopolyspora sp. 5N708]|uniref:LppU/SCO3897 family protein n=1 Tax=Saccharopolyspora sp. 5N708 TaxID=3457424 RepID=UPI003FD0AF03